MKPKQLTLIVIFAAVATACVANPNPPEQVTSTMSPEKMLSALVGLATDEDLVDHERVAKLLSLRIVMKPDSKEHVTSAGRPILGATAEEPADPGYLPKQGPKMYYRVVTRPLRSATFSIHFDSGRLCLNINDVLAQFGKHGTLRPGPPPISNPPPDGAVPSEIPKSHPHYAYLFKGISKAAVLTFAYSNCLTDFSTHQSEAQN
jgi:hypothetical protein